jgi:hypothetical protein
VGTKKPKKARSRATSTTMQGNPAFDTKHLLSRSRDSLTLRTAAALLRSRRTRLFSGDSTLRLLAPHPTAPPAFKVGRRETTQSMTIATSKTLETSKGFRTQKHVTIPTRSAGPKASGAVRRKKLSGLFWLRFCNAVGTRLVAFTNRFLHSKELRFANQMRAARYVVNLIVVILGYGDRIG